ncbi:MAG TPA: hypothetical protein IGS17_09320 [Oscillatoriales cyanobacterium M59_W2019_021]|nr:MAG: hypothetical protein D6728_19290 [Cyanobacteria bacterium J055]HIK33591.1 hypothetical protein [Oscillatoriales cyanobacterium M4454_W2019_049]HIK51108.1 hypothetical protein [Oscillatoriales cyanobacterium M59_W2019_021]
MSLKLHSILLGIALLYTILPILLAFAGASFAQLCGCEPNESGFTCEGRPFLSELFSVMAHLHLFALITVPTGGIASLILGVSLGVRFLW